MLEEKKFKIYWDEKNEIARFEMNKMVIKVNKELADLIFDKAVSFLNSRPEKNINVLVNVANSQPADSIVRKILAKTLNINKMSKIAIYSTKNIQRIIVNFIAKASGKKNSRAFASEIEAINWLEK